MLTHEQPVTNRAGIPKSTPSPALPSGTRVGDEPNGWFSEPAN